MKQLDVASRLFHQIIRLTACTHVGSSHMIKKESQKEYTNSERASLTLPLSSQEKKKKKPFSGLQRFLLHKIASSTGLTGEGYTHQMR